MGEGVSSGAPEGGRGLSVSGRDQPEGALAASACRCWWPMACAKTAPASCSAFSALAARARRTWKRCSTTSTGGQAVAAARAFCRRRRRDYPSVVKQLERDLPELLAFFQFPKHLWRKLRTINIIERCSVEVREEPVPWSASSTGSPWTESSTPSSSDSTWNGKPSPSALLHKRFTSPQITSCATFTFVDGMNHQLNSIHIFGYYLSPLPECIQSRTTTP